MEEDKKGFLLPQLQGESISIKDGKMYHLI
jgi:hypothetical protein